MVIQPEPIPMPTLDGRGADRAETGVAAAKAGVKPAGTATTALSVLGADVDGGESGLTYTWSATTVPDGATAPTFSVNGTNAAKNTTATLSKAGTYGFTATIAPKTIGIGGSLSVTSSVSVAVPQTLTTIAVSPAQATVNPEATQQFTATGYDQFGSALATQPRFAWTTNVGTISEGGLFTAQNSPGSGQVTAGVPGTPGRDTIHGASSVTVTKHAPSVAKAASAAPPAAAGPAPAEAKDQRP